MAWIGLEALLVASPIRLMARCRLLAAFGAKLGRGVVIKPGVRVKFPRKLAIGDHSWIGERVWIDNLAPVEIGANCCISQGAYLCARQSRLASTGFDLITAPIRLNDYAWVAASSLVGSGVTLGEGSVLAMGSASTAGWAPWTIYRGNPAIEVGK